MPTPLKQWEEETEMLTEYFVERYFGKDADWFWIAGDVGGCIEVGDYFFNLANIVDFIRYKYTRKQMFEWYNYIIDYGMKPKKDRTDGEGICIRDYKKLKKAK